MGRHYPPKQKGRPPWLLIDVPRTPKPPRVCPHCNEALKDDNPGHLIPACFGEPKMWICGGVLTVDQKSVEEGLNYDPPRFQEFRQKD